MEKVVKYFKKLMEEPILNQNIKVYGWEFNYEYQIVGSVVPYLFESLDIKENIAKETNENRDGRLREKKYIVIHDTGDTHPQRNAKFWSDVVQNEFYNGSKYAASYQYVVGPDGVYHQIPDDEIAYHAGDSTYFDYALYKTGVKGETSPIVTIEDDGYYYVNNQKTKIVAPTLDGKIMTTADINDMGVLCKLIDDEYYIGETYVNGTYKRIANRGGNNNGIGMEVCVTQNTDLYYTYQLSSKLTARLLKENNLTLDDIKQHHYFSGKDCPMTLRKNNLWNHFMHLVEVEQAVSNFIDEGYEFKLVPLTTNVLSNGRITNINEDIHYQIIIKYQNKEETLTF